MLAYVSVALAPSIVRPAPLAAAASAAFLANVIFLSVTSNVVLLIEVVVPSTCKLPSILTSPVASPIAAGSIVRVEGPIILPATITLLLESTRVSVLPNESTS